MLPELTIEKGRVQNGTVKDGKLFRELALEMTWQSKEYKEQVGAGDGIRTRGDLLGGQAFYH